MVTKGTKVLHAAGCECVNVAGGIASFKRIFCRHSLLPLSSLAMGETQQRSPGTEDVEFNKVHVWRSIGLFKCTQVKAPHVQEE